MMTLILNGKTAEPIEISTYSRNFDIPDATIRYRLNINLNGNYSSNSIEYLANYADAQVTDMKVIASDGTTELLATDTVNAKLESLTETCDNDIKYGYAAIIVYETAAVPPRSIGVN